MQFVCLIIEVALFHRTCIAAKGTCGSPNILNHVPQRTLETVSFTFPPAKTALSTLSNGILCPENDCDFAVHRLLHSLRCASRGRGCFTVAILNNLLAFIAHKIISGKRVDVGMGLLV